MIHVELGEISWRRQSFQDEHNSDNLKVDLDLINEIKEEAQVKEEATKNRQPTDITHG